MAEVPYGRDYPDPWKDLDGQHIDDPATETLGGTDRPLFPAPTAPLEVARKVYAGHRLGGNGIRTLVAWRGGWMSWRITDWAELDAAHLRSEIYDALGDVDYNHPIRKEGEIVGYEVRPWSPDKHKVANVLEAMAAIGHLSTEVDAPSWIDLHSAAEIGADHVISCKNGLLDLSTRTVHKHTPALFNVVSVPFDYHIDAAEPAAWLEFLHSVWPNDTDSIALLQEYVGYVLSGRTDMQKLLMLIGPTRSGKGTIARLLAKLIGIGNMAGPTLASLGSNFGLSPLLGKPLAIISDARLGSTPAHTVVERLLSITGEDLITVDRKFRDPWSGKLPTRFVILSNELPRFHDSSGAIANRMLILQMTESFLGREDRTLDARLSDELAGILNWALEGLDRLNRNGRFTVPGSSEDAANLMMDLASPVSAFVRERCVRKLGETVARDVIYNEWKLWAEDNGHEAGAKSTFARNLRSVVPELRDVQHRINGVPVRHYTRIGLISNLNGDDPASPASGNEPSGETGHPASGRSTNQHVSGHETGEAGEGLFKGQHEELKHPFNSDPASANGEDRTCSVPSCINRLKSPESRVTGKCKPCRDKLMSGYDR
jgi:putative DNA primase/helicase